MRGLTGVNPVPSACLMLVLQSDNELLRKISTITTPSSHIATGGEWIGVKSWIQCYRIQHIDPPIDYLLTLSVF